MPITAQIEIDASPEEVRNVVGSQPKIPHQRFSIISTHTYAIARRKYKRKAPTDDVNE